MKKCCILITAVCAIITLASCSNMLEDLRKAKNKRNVEIVIKTVTDDSKKTNRVKITVDTGDKEIEKTGYVFSEPGKEKEWKNTEEVLTDSGFTGITKDSDGKYIINATRNGDYTVAVKDKDGNKKYETVKVDSIIPVNEDIPMVSIKKKGEAFDVTVTGLNITADDFDSDAFRVVCTDSSGNEVTEVTDGAVITRNNDGSIKVTLTIPENRGEYEITIECNTKEYGDVSLNGTLNVDIIYYTVTFNTNGGSKVEAQKVEEGTKVQKPANPGKTEDGSLYEFQSWCYENGTEYNFNTTINSNITLYAKWNVTLDFAYYEKLVVLGENHIQFGAWPQTIMERGVEINEKDSPSCTQGMFTYYKGNYNYKNDSSAGWYVKCSNQYFKLEPIKWRVLTENYNETGKALLLAENILQAMVYYDGGNRTVSYNNYEHSQVRAFLNGYTYTLNDGQNGKWDGKGFLQTAFTEKAAGNIETTAVINNARSTNPADNSEANNRGINEYASDIPTDDKIFLLSMQEVSEQNYGFDEDYKYDTARKLSVTDYAKASGVYVKSGNGNWWLRSPNYTFSSDIYYIKNDGYGCDYATYGSSSLGVVPALTIDLTAYSYTVTFDTDGGSEVAQQAVLKGGKAQKPDDPIKTIGDDNLYDFQGWYDENGTAYDFSTPVNTDITLKAKWNKIKLDRGYKGDIIEFGSWPQSEAENITAGNLTATGKKYDGENEEYKDAENNYYVKVEDKYYKVEPIKWRVIATYFDGRKLLLADKILTNISYYGDYSERKLNDTTIYPNNYKYSNIRAYLNSTKNQFVTDSNTTTSDDDWEGKGFLTSAFTDKELEKIKTTAVDNSAASTGYDSNEYACENTEDKVHLLSYKEATNPLYGLSNDEDRIMQATAYAKANGAYQRDTEGEGSYWRLRSPCRNFSNIACIIYSDGYISTSNYVNRNDVGVVPAMIVENLYTVTFDTDGGSTVPLQTVSKGEKAVQPPVPIKTDVDGNLYEFQGWYNDGVEYYFDTPVTADITLKAKWEVSSALGLKILEGAEKNGTASTGWDYVLFGRWPQTIKADGVTVDENTTIKQGMFNYCLGSDGQWYVKIKERACHPVCKYSDGTTAKESSADSWKWFKVEPIKWRVLTTNYNGTGKKLLFAESVLANSVYYDYQSVNRTVGGKTIHPNNYEHSRVRAFLNGLSYQRKASVDGEQTACEDFLGKGFLQTAFSAKELAIIADTSVDNSERSTFPNANAKQWNNGENPYASDTPTTDKVFLLSLQEVTTGAYGFDEDHNAAGVGNARIRAATDYARASGANQNGAEGLGGWWWQRSPFYGDDYSAHYADRDGDSFYSAIVSEVYEGVGYGDIVPALCVE